MATALLGYLCSKDSSNKKILHEGGDKYSVSCFTPLYVCRCGGREGGREGRRERGGKGGRERGKERERGEGREGEREGEREGGREGGREGESCLRQMNTCSHTITYHRLKRSF